jgi:hypothetical protein
MIFKYFGSFSQDWNFMVRYFAKFQATGNTFNLITYYIKFSISKIR